jgi:hypothetical protein
MEPEQRKKIGEMLKSFKGNLVTNELLEAYCKRHGITPVLVMSQYEDYLFQYDHDERFTNVMPLLLEALSKLQQPPEFCSQEEHKAVVMNNNEVELRLAMILEENGILWSEATTLIGNFGILVSSAIERAKNSVKNMGEATMLHITEAQLGKPLTLKAAADYFRTEADKLR